MCEEMLCINVRLKGMLVEYWMAASCVAGVWLLARCADLAAMQYDVTQFWYAIKVLLYIGLGSRIAACLAMLTLHRDKSL
jgi:hypothetical protein